MESKGEVTAVFRVCDSHGDLTCTDSARASSLSPVFLLCSELNVYRTTFHILDLRVTWFHYELTELVIRINTQLYY